MVGSNRGTGSSSGSGNRSRGERWRGRQRRIGLTGGIASGKSTVGRILAESFGLPVLDADTYAREALAAGSVGAEAVLARYGPVVRAKTSSNGTAAIDRAALGRIVFADAAERLWLEQLVHPRVRTRFDQELQRLAAEPVVVLMIPLLFEAGLDNLCSEIWLVDCDAAEQRQRLLHRDGLAEAEALRRIHAQWPLERKRALADRLIDNRGTSDALTKAVERALAAAGQSQ
ncbi:dephospho-CoA kinase [Synechococcus sp. CBW1002]|uniref:dephospho-CoA kinase n=1 Tax=unclassified Synechococcus TaxID=2626047 RepID=UPI0018CDB0FB|nr:MULTISPECIES: dephospho-CoA kinase [unclassified Synechococcus]QPN60452.1 dephospho-CoA kinase [Synechococcus sp. CBW1002]QPN67832.1 dephospho-CoA kinase [Synechococcus sp. CBW1006]